jgi:hypothetical protein
MAKILETSEESNARLAQVAVSLMDFINFKPEFDIEREMQESKLAEEINGIKIEKQEWE